MGDPARLFTTSGVAHSGDGRSMDRLIASAAKVTHNIDSVD
jgi:hypothetical protein